MSVHEHEVEINVKQCQFFFLNVIKILHLRSNEIFISVPLSNSCNGKELSIIKK